MVKIKYLKSNNIGTYLYIPKYITEVFRRENLNKRNGKAFIYLSEILSFDSNFSLEYKFLPKPVNVIAAFLKDRK